MKHPAKNINETNILKSFFLGRHVIGIIVVILWISSGGCSQPSRPHSLEKADATETDGSIVARVNEEPISVVHFKRVMQHNRAMVHNYFAQKYNAQDNMDFWTTEYEGETPIKVLRQKTLEE